MIYLLTFFNNEKLAAQILVDSDQGMENIFSHWKNVLQAGKLVYTKAKIESDQEQPGFFEDFENNFFVGDVVKVNNLSAWETWDGIITGKNKHYFFVKDLKTLHILCVDGFQMTLVSRG